MILSNSSEAGRHAVGEAAEENGWSGLPLEPDACIQLCDRAWAMSFDAALQVAPQILDRVEVR